MEPVKIGVIGVGGMGASHCTAAVELEEYELAAVADVNEDTAREVGEKYGAKYYTSYEELIDNGGVEAVAIVTPHFFHPPIAEYAAKRGVHVLSEKPIAVTTTSARRMVDVCAEAGVLVGVMFQQRTEPWRRKVYDMVHGGELGTMYRISMTVPWYRAQAYYDSGAWRGTWKGEGGGILMNQAPHSLDQFVWIGGQPKSVQAIATTRLHNIEVENTAIAICDYGDGKVGSFYATTAEAPAGETLEVVGDNGVLKWDGSKLRFMKLDTPMSRHLAETDRMWGGLEGEWNDVEIPESSVSGFTLVHRQFARAVRAGDASLLIANGEDGLRSLELANAILLAGYTRCEVKLPIDPDAFDEMLQKLQAGTKPDELYKGSSNTVG